MSQPSQNKNDFAGGLKELEKIAAWFESEDIDLDEALGKFERGMELASKLKAQLSEIENKVEVIKQKFAAPEIQKPSEPTDASQAVSEPDLFSQP
jgi:exodeoxyribonuclease VII small subunit